MKKTALSYINSEMKFCFRSPAFIKFLLVWPTFSRNKQFLRKICKKLKPTNGVFTGKPERTAAKLLPNTIHLDKPKIIV